jgi:hypothetical protein
MAKKSIDKKSIHISGNLTGDSIMGDGNVIHKPTINNNIDSDGLGQSISDALSDREDQAKWDEFHRGAGRQESREVMETIFVSIVSGIAMGSCWNFVFPWNAETVPFFVTATTVFLNIIRVTNFGLRRSLFKIILLSSAFFLLLKYVPFTQTWMDVNQFVGSTILATIGAIIGLFVGVIQTFWHPFEGSAFV